MRRYAHKVDGNQADMFAVWRKLGANVEDTSALGGDFPDALVTYRGKMYLAEIKDGYNKLSAGQEMFARRQEAHGGRVYIIRDERDALAMLGAKLGV